MGTINRECVVLVVNIIYCDLPYANAVAEECEDIDTHNIYINKNLPHGRMREEIKHELMHIINDDFYLDEHVNLVEQMVRRSDINDSELESIDFYHHFNV
nr:MAG TPA: IrrE N-terminal-like domain [Caudoviricetes sp.]